MLITYYKEVTQELDVNTLVHLLIDDIGESEFDCWDIDCIENYFGDNIEYYLEKYGIKEELTKYTISEIIKETFKIIEKLKCRK